MGIYLASVVLVGRARLAAIAGAAGQRRQPAAAPGSWGLGRIQSRLAAALQRTVGDGLHGLRCALQQLKAAAAACQETAEGRLLRAGALRASNAWRDTLVVASPP